MSAALCALPAIHAWQPTHAEIAARRLPLAGSPPQALPNPADALAAGSNHLRQLQQVRSNDYNISQPLVVCTASIQDFGARCNGAPDPSLEDEVKPAGPVPPQGWCPLGDRFCGYSVSVFECAPLL